MFQSPIPAWKYNDKTTHTHVLTWSPGKRHSDDVSLSSSPHLQLLELHQLTPPALFPRRRQ